MGKNAYTNVCSQKFFGLHKETLADTWCTEYTICQGLVNDNVLIIRITYSFGKYLFLYWYFISVMKH